MTVKPLLGPDEPSPVRVHNAGGAAPFLLVADHAGNRVPRALGDLGLSEQERGRHIGWDIGIAGVGHVLADALDAVFIQQVYSRLVIDCNRPLAAPSSIPEISERTGIPGNRDLSPSDRDARAREIFWPYHHCIAAELDRRLAAGQPTALVALHSFTPVFKDVARPWQAGMLYNRDPRLARQMLALLRGEGLSVGDNEPYFVSDSGDYTIPVHGERRELPHVLIEIRQDLIAEPKGQHDWAALFARLLPQAYRAI